jgi:hypothetical protein
MTKRRFLVVIATAHSANKTQPQIIKKASLIQLINEAFYYFNNVTYQFSTSFMSGNW